MNGAVADRTEPVQASWPDLTCYGCGPANPAGLHLERYLGAGGDALVATVVPDERFNAGVPNVMYGGHVASLIDCHAIWTAITFAYAAERRPLGSAPRIAFVTGRLHVDFLEPTPLDRPIALRAWIVGDVARRTTVRCELGPAGTTTVTGEVLAVRVEAPELSGHHSAASVGSAVP